MNRRRGRKMPAAEYIGCDSRADLHSPELATLVAANLFPNRLVLDLGCGNGTEGMFLASHGFSVTAIDASTKALAAAQQRRKQLPPAARSRIEFVEGDALSLRHAWGGKFGGVVERLLFVNLRQDQGLKLLQVAAAALCERGLLVLRMSFEGPVGWGTVRRGLFFAKKHVTLFERYFDGVPRPIGFMGLVTDPWVTDGSLVLRGHQQAIVVSKRNGRLFSARRPSRPALRP